LKARDFMTSLIVAAEHDTPVVEAARLMAAEDIGSLIVTRSEILAGMVTRREVVGAQLLSDEAYHGLVLSDIMTTPVITIGPDADLGQVISLMNQTGERHVPVIEGDTIIGIITATDIIRVLATMKGIADGATSEQYEGDDEED
jgi:CBS domain-containing protein